MTNSGMPHIPTEDTPTPQGGLEKPSDNSQSVATMSVSAVVAYLEHPKVLREFHGSTLDGMLEVDFETDTLKEMIYSLNEKQLGRLMEKVTTVRAQWSALRVAPGNDIGTIARYQEADLIIQHRVTDLTTEGLSLDTVTPSRPGEHKKQELERDGNG